MREIHSPRSIVKSDGGKSLLGVKGWKLSKTYEKYEFFVRIAYMFFLRAMRAIHTRLLFKMSGFEQKSEVRMSKRANSQPCHKSPQAVEHAATKPREVITHPSYLVAAVLLLFIRRKRLKSQFIDRVPPIGLSLIAYFLNIFSHFLFFFC